MPGEPVRVAIADDVVTITLDSQHNRNALSVELMTALDAALDTAEAARPRAIVLRHEGPAFCSGADLKQRAADGIPDSSPVIRAMQRLMDAECPTIAAVDGTVRAGGMGLMAACDLIVVHPAVTFSLPEVRIGVAPAIVLVPLLRRVAPSHLVAATLAGETLDAPTALRIGLVTHIATDVARAVDDLVGAIRLGAPTAVTESKRALWRIPTMDRPAAFAEMKQLSESLFRSEDGQEGLRAFAEKRPPRWQQTG